MRGPCVVAILALLVGAGAAHADEPSAERLRAAAKEYDEGRRLYLDGQYEAAAVQFENAYVDVPRAEALRNAIRARRSAKQYARAATLAQLALTQYDADAATSALANDAMAEALPKVHAVILSCEPKCAVAADGRALSFADARVQRVFLEPGPRELVVTFGNRSREVKIDANAGDKTELSMDAPTAPLPPPPAPGAQGDAGGSAGGKPFGPAVFLTVAGLTLVAGGVTAWSGIDAQNNPGPDAVRRDCVGQGASCPTYQRGLDAQLRTNVLLGVTGGLALIAGVVGVFFTEWSRPASRPAAAGRAAVVRLAPVVVVGGAGAGLNGAF